MAGPLSRIWDESYGRLDALLAELQDQPQADHTK